MLNFFCKLIQLTKLVRIRCFILILLLSLFVNHTFASGAYMPSSSPHAKSQYNQGKMIFHKQRKSQKFLSCLECYKEHKTESKCEKIKQCVTGDVSGSQVDALKYFLKKRYRLN